LAFFNRKSVLKLGQHKTGIRTRSGSDTQEAETMQVKRTWDCKECRFATLFEWQL
jgi:hypothetical protein